MVEHPESASTHEMPRARNGRANKIYRGPPTPSKHEMERRERSWIADNIAVAGIERNAQRVNPKVESIIPPYNSQQDRLTRRYFKSATVRKVLMRNGQSQGGTTIRGEVMDRMIAKSHSTTYLEQRNTIAPTAHSLAEFGGHDCMMSLLAPRPPIGYNGPTGARRNTPHLRSLYKSPLSCPFNFNRSMFSIKGSGCKEDYDDELEREAQRRRALREEKRARKTAQKQKSDIASNDDTAVDDGPEQERHDNLKAEGIAV